MTSEQRIAYHKNKVLESERNLVKSIEDVENAKQNLQTTEAFAAIKGWFLMLDIFCLNVGKMELQSPLLATIFDSENEAKEALNKLPECPLFLMLELTKNINKNSLRIEFIDNSIE